MEARWSSEEKDSDLLLVSFVWMARVVPACDDAMTDEVGTFKIIFQDMDLNIFWQ